MDDTGNSLEARDILVVDDHTRVRQYVTNLLSAIGHRITVANDGSQALSLILRKKFDLLITDLEMAPLDGYSLLALMRNLPPDQRIAKVIVCSAHVTDPAIQRAPELRGARLVPKPIHPRELLVAVAESLPRHSRMSAWLSSSVESVRGAAAGLFRSARR